MHTSAHWESFSCNQCTKPFCFSPKNFPKDLYKPSKLKSLKVAKSKDDDDGVVDGSVNGVLMLCVMVCVMVCMMVC